MRLTAAEIDAIRTCAERVFGEGSVVRLFGSRIDDRRRGGDIDLHIVAATPERAGIAQEIVFALDLKALIGEQRIDVIARPPGFAPRPIDEVALRTGEVLG